MADLKCTMPGREVIQQNIPTKVTYRYPKRDMLWSVT